MVLKFLQKIFGTKNDKELKKYNVRLNSINAFSDEYSSFSDEEIKISFKKIQEYYKDNKDADLLEKLPEVFSLIREASSRVLKMRHYDVQLVGGMVLHDGRIAEMKTGEGKTLVATLPAILNTLKNQSVHIVTVNDYLANRDAISMKDLYEFFDLSVGIITTDISEELKHENYSCDVVYGTNNEFAFSYLKDNMKYSMQEVSQKSHDFAIIDEVDSILIDEARTPLIISGPVSSNIKNYSVSDKIAKQLSKDTHFTINEQDKVVLINEEGIQKAEELFGVDNLYDLQNAQFAHILDQSLKANYLFEKDVDYVVKENEVIIVDEFTGRLSEGRRFSDGLHQALEAKENVIVKEESQTLADISFQNYFRMYGKLAGMTGTAQTEATEFIEIYNLDVVSIPTNVPIARIDKNDLIYASKKEKLEAVVKQIKNVNKTGQPVLVGTTSIEQSEEIHNILKKEKIAHSILNAKNHTKEAEIIMDAGVKGAVTVATNMAGRGVDIKISDEVENLGGLYIIGTERHESRRIDNQLRGRSGRQGDRGITQFYLSLEDNLLRIFGSDRIKTVMQKLGIEYGEHIESSMVTRAVENAQKKIESMNFESRKHLLEFDDVANKQRLLVYQFRRELLDRSVNIKEKIQESLKVFLDDVFDRCEILPSSMKEDINEIKLKSILKEELGIDGFVEFEDYDSLYTNLQVSLMQIYEQKMSPFPKDDAINIESSIYVQTLDGLWQEHLHQMDSLKTGIGLRGYNQKDPVVEYKKESFHLFQEFIIRVKLDVFKTLFIVNITTEDIQETLHQEEENQWQVADSYNEQDNKSKVKRNDPCPCGSGKKFKQCHGRNGSKKY